MKTPPRQIQAVRTILLGAALLCAAALLGRGARSALSDENTSPHHRERDPRSRRKSLCGNAIAVDRTVERDAAAIAQKGWENIARRVYHNFSEDRIQLVAAGVTFYGILAIFPTIAALVSIYGLVANPNTIDHHVNDLRGALPDGAIAVISGQARRLAERGNGALGLAAVASLLLSLWSANSGVKGVFDALDIAFDEEEKRSFIRLNLQSLAFTAGALLFVAQPAQTGESGEGNYAA